MIDNLIARKKDGFSLSLSLAVLGVVYGDIGTSPIYAFRLALSNMPINVMNILGLCSLIFWTLIIIITIKYLILIFQADNEGEGGILALFALLKQKNVKHIYFFYIIAIFGAGLLLGDGMLTPAISVMSAVEGLKQVSPVFSPYLILISCIILLPIFAMQSIGTGGLSKFFSPFILVWFVSIAVLGLIQIINNPIILKALNPYYAFNILISGGLSAYFMLGGLFLVVTGGEALFADIGQFGKNPIRYSWFFVVFPSLVLSYLGQGAFLLNHPFDHPFYDMVPSWFNVPLVILAIIATAIASQAIITATFTLTKQAILLGFCPRIPIIQTSHNNRGQIYIPEINLILFFGSIFFLFIFETSDNLAHAYGIAVNFYMLLITFMVAYTAVYIWRWSLIKVIFTFGILLIIDLLFLGANLPKFFSGGWISVFLALLITFVMYTWSIGLNFLREYFYLKKEHLSKILKQLDYKTLNHLEGVTSIFITDVYDQSGGGFLHFLKLSLTVPEHVLIVSYKVDNVPYVAENKRYEVNNLNNKICQLILHYGFMDFISIPYALNKANRKNILPFNVDVNTTNYILEIPNFLASPNNRSPLYDFQEKFFVFLMRNYSANLDIEFYNLPYDRTMAIGTYCLI